jgi:hypothetical protein
LIIRGPDGTGEPRFTPTIVAFNGNASVGESVEAFMITFDDLRVPIGIAVERISATMNSWFCTHWLAWLPTFQRSVLLVMEEKVLYNEA